MNDAVIDLILPDIPQQSLQGGPLSAERPESFSTNSSTTSAKLEVEEAALDRRACVLSLPMTYGPFGISVGRSRCRVACEPAAAGRVLNVRGADVAGQAVGHDGAGRGVDLPEDLGLTRLVAQPLVVSWARALALLDYRDTPVEVAIADSVAWHMAHPPADIDADFTADNLALAAYH